MTVVLFICMNIKFGNVEGHLRPTSAIDVLAKCKGCNQVAVFDAKTGGHACEHGCPPPCTVEQRFNVVQVDLMDAGHTAQLKLASPSVAGMLSISPDFYARYNSEGRWRLLDTVWNQIIRVVVACNGGTLWGNSICRVPP